MLKLTNDTQAIRRIKKEDITMEPYLIGVLVFCIVAIFAIYFVQNKEDDAVVTEETFRVVKKLIDENPIFVASKTWCPYCKQAIGTLTRDFKVPESKMKVLQLNELEHGREIQKALFLLNGQKTVPSIYINQIFIGGNDDLQEMKQTGKLGPLIKEALP